MTLTIPAIYHDGQLRLLQSVNLRDGQQVEVSIEVTDEREILKGILGDLVTWSNPADDSEAWVETMADELDRAYQGETPLSQIVIDDRGES
jgi:predicted DNA-binding antitoxin AbrB/MazE fold protein